MRSVRRNDINATALILMGVLSACSTGSPAPSPLPLPSQAASASGAALTITGVEYAYQGVPASVKAGTVVSFTNGGKEVHELIAIRRNDGVTTSVDELIAMPEAESDKLVTILPVVAIATPGESAPDPVVLDKPGSYIFMCFIPVGTTAFPSEDPGASVDPSASVEPGGPPHFTQGMVAELTVTE
jgi:uncharacterized cupredoxin-like copper-binding protein